MTKSGLEGAMDEAPSGEYASLVKADIETVETCIATGVRDRQCLTERSR